MMKSAVRATFLLAALGLLSAGTAAADTRDASIKLGPLRVIPILGLDIGHTTNIFLAPDDTRLGEGELKQSDTVTTLQYGLEAVLPARDWTFTVGGMGLTHWYQDFSNNDNTDASVWASVGADFPGGLSFTVQDRYDIGYLLPSNEFGPGEDFSLNSLTADVQYDFYQSFRIRARYTNNYVNYDDSDDRDRVEQIIEGWLYRNIAPKTALSVGVAYSDFGYDDNVPADNTATEVNAGITWGATAKSTGVFQVGYEWKDYTQERDNGEYWTVRGGMRYRLRPKTLTTLTLLRGTVETSFVNNPWYLNSGLEGDLTHDFRRWIYAKLFAGYWKDDYPNEAIFRGQVGEREDDTWRLEGGVGFRLMKRLTLEFTVGREERNSNFDSLDYDENIALLSLNLGLGMDYERYRRRY